MDTLSKQDLGVFALEFLDNLEQADGDSEYYVAIFLVADLDEAGDVRVSMRTSGSNGMANLRVLQQAQLLETRTIVEAAEDGE